MRIRLLPILVVAGVLAALPAPASAAFGGGFFRWWDSLSGPGPFNGIVLDAMFVCYGTHFAPGADPNAPDPKYATDVFIDAGCLNARRDRRRVSVGVQWAAAWSEENNLVYPDRGKAPQVKAYPFLIVAHYGLNKGMDAGLGVGVVKFSGDGFGFSRFIIEPQLSVRPFALLSKSENPPLRAEVLDLRFFMTGIPGSMTAADFGATDTWSSDGEFQYGFSITFNALALIGRRP